MTWWVRTLIGANVGMFLFQYFAPGVANDLMFVPTDYLTRPWTLVTYMFLHSSTQHIFFNMLGLFFFGPRVESFLGSQRFITLYLISGVMGALVSVMFARQYPIIGASGAVYGVSLAFAMQWPRERLMIWGVFPVEARWLIVGTTVLSVYGGFGGSGDGVAHFAHLGGFVGAYLYLKWVEHRAPVKQWQRKVAGPPPSKVPIGDWKRVDLAKVHEANRDEVSRILEKINTKGPNSLTTPERTFLQHFVPREGEAS